MAPLGTFLQNTCRARKCRMVKPWAITHTSLQATYRARKFSLEKS